jgi:hypothetical protein
MGITGENGQLKRAAIEKDGPGMDNHQTIKSIPLQLKGNFPYYT